MKVILFKDLLIALITQALESKEHGRIIRDIINNHESKFIFSKKYLSFLKEEIDSSYIDEYQALFKKFTDEGTIIKASEESQFLEDEIIYLYSSSKNDVVVIAYSTSTAPLINSIPKIASIKEATKPNYHWIVVQLAILHPNKVTVTCSDFTNNADINIFLNNCYSILKYISQVHIFEAQCNLEHNDKFDYFKTNKIKVNYYTKTNPRFKKEDRKNDIYDKFGSLAKTFILLKNNKAHGRRVIFDNIILTFDEDFWSLTVDESDWNIDIQYSESVANTWLSMITKYQEAR